MEITWTLEAQFVELGEIERGIMVLMQRLDNLPRDRKVSLARTQLEQGLHWVQSREFDLRAVGLPDEAARIGRKADL